MHFREAKVADIKQMQIVRNSVNENVLSNPDLIKDADYEEYFLDRGKGWVCELDETVIGFAIADLKQNNIWALFVLPAFLAKGIGRQLHSLMLNWYFKNTNQTVWLSTAPNTRAELFYTKQGWTNVGLYGSSEVKFEMTYNQWHSLLEG